MDLEIKAHGAEAAQAVEDLAEYHDYILREIGITFEELKERKFIIQTPRYKKYEEKEFDAAAKRVLFGKTRGGGFNTPSGKVGSSFPP